MVFFVNFFGLIFRWPKINLKYILSIMNHFFSFETVLLVDSNFRKGLSYATPKYTSFYQEKRNDKFWQDLFVRLQ